MYSTKVKKGKGKGKEKQENKIEKEEEQGERRRPSNKEGKKRMGKKTACLPNI